MFHEHDLSCPYCGETFTIFIDISQGNHHTIEDCYVCCRPIEFIVESDGSQLLSISAYTDSDNIY